MTEVEWLTAADPTPMLEFIQGKASDRKARLFALACVNRIIHPDLNHALIPVLHTIERHIDGGLGDTEFTASGKLIRNKDGDLEAVWVCRHLCLVDQPGALIAAASSVYSADAAAKGRPIETCVFRAHLRLKPRWAEERLAQTVLLNDIIGNPFRPGACDPAWLTSDVLTLTTSIYEERAFDRMPILADALQDAGCDNEDVLSHCRGDGPHVRGCWVVDLLLGKK